MSVGGGDYITKYISIVLQFLVPREAGCRDGARSCGCVRGGFHVRDNVWAWEGVLAADFLQLKDTQVLGIVG